VDDEKKCREVAYCQSVAREINAAEKTDYHAEPANQEPADCIFVSESGRFPLRRAQVVTIPQDFTHREDNNNIVRLKRDLARTLKKHGLDHCFTWDGLTDDGSRCGLKSDEVLELSNLVRERAVKDNATLQGVEIWQYSSRLGKLVAHVGFFSAPALKDVCVSVSVTRFVPKGGDWIEEAINAKAKKYGGSEAVASLMLVIGALGLAGREQIDAFRRAHPPKPLPFEEIWIVSHDGTIPLKPRS